MISQGYSMCITDGQHKIYLYDKFFDGGGHKCIGINSSNKKVVIALMEEFPSIGSAITKAKAEYAKRYDKRFNEIHEDLVKTNIDLNSMFGDASTDEELLVLAKKQIDGIGGVEKELIDFGDSTFVTATVNELAVFNEYGKTHDDVVILVFGDEKDFKEFNITEFTVERCHQTYFIKHDNKSTVKPVKKTASSILERARLVGGIM